MKVTVQHAKFDCETGAIVDYTPVAEVNAFEFNEVEDALEYAYRWTNNVMGSWSRKEQVFENGAENGDYNDNVKVLAPLHKGGMGLRSSMMGDRFIVDGETYRVAAFGFKKVDVEAA